MSKSDRQLKPEPPATYRNFVQRYPKLGQAWSIIGECGGEGPLDPRTVRLVKLAVAMGAMREGPVHSNVRKALAEGIGRDEIEQIVALTAGTIGLPSTAAVYTWAQDVLGDGEGTD